MSTENIDPEGYRANVGIILANDEGQLLLAGRVGNKGWQFPQGGMHPNESPEEAMFRELYEEIGLEASQVEILGCTDDWLRYRLPDKFVRRGSMPLCIGQKQLWFMLRFLGDDEQVRLDCSDDPEFDRWRWVDFWRPVNDVIYFKRRVYARALHELGPHVYPEGLPPRPRWWPKRWKAVFDKDIERARRVSARPGPQSAAERVPESH
ncbi:MAG: RNA pyrophosphohydrolase [Gammaproteobacteria bacterium]|nr:RNA pyrophosphohydrolase [Gammaproteobacteria bacterium]MDH5309339.1 RNA pyrophosphohydrolase [Gammaproteobacteria bacterium]